MENEYNEGAGTKKVSLEKNPFKSKKFIAKLIGFAMLGPIGWMPVEGGTATLSSSTLGNLILLIFLITSLYKIALKRPNGWLWFASFFYYGAFAHIGIVAWFYMAITGLALWVYKRWAVEA
jgi:hypothetical protein